MAYHRIGPFYFQAAWGQPDFYGGKIASETRAGVDGQTLIDLGTWGEPCEVETLAFTTDYAHARQLFRAYKSMIKSDPVPVWIGNILDTLIVYQVENVVPLEVGRVIGSWSSGDPNRYQGVVRARWKLIPLQTQQQVY